MLLLMMCFLIIFTLSMILLFISLTVSKKSNSIFEKQSPFECGFDFFSYSRMPFSLKFFLIAIIFIIFDIEIALILPFIPSIFKSNIFKWSFLSIFFMFILFIGVIFEWKEASFEWKF